jgi:hypothetical protein
MADNVPITAGVGTEIATDEVSGVHYQRVKLDIGADGVSDPITATNPLPISGTFWQATQPVSAESLPLPTGAATQTTLAAIEGYFKAEDTAAASGDKGLPALAMRASTDAVTTDADGDYTLLKVDEEGRLKVSAKPASYADITGDITAVQATIGTPVAGGTVSGDVSRASNIMAFCTGTFSTVNCTFEGSIEASGDTNWFGIQAVRTNANTIETTTGNLSAQPAYGWEMSVNALKRVRVRCTARTSGTQSWRFVQGTYATEPIPAAQVSATQPVSGTVTATVTGGTTLPVTPTQSFINSAATTNAAFIKNSAGTVWSIVCSNANASARYVKLYNLATAPTVGTSVPAFTIAVPATGTVTVNGGSNGIRFGTGIAIAITASMADSDTTAVAANEIKVATSYT